MWYHIVSWIERACLAQWLNQRLLHRLQVQIQAETQNLRAFLIFNNNNNSVWKYNNDSLYTHTHLIYQGIGLLTIYLKENSD